MTKFKIVPSESYTFHLLTLFFYIALFVMWKNGELDNGISQWGTPVVILAAISTLVSIVLIISSFTSRKIE